MNRTLIIVTELNLILIVYQQGNSHCGRTCYIKFYKKALAYIKFCNINSCLGSLKVSVISRPIKMVNSMCYSLNFGWIFDCGRLIDHLDICSLVHHSDQRVIFFGNQKLGSTCATHLHSPGLKHGTRLSLRRPKPVFTKSQIFEKDFTSLNA